jgi:BASS family bile acid:Na+ symporter
MAAIARTHLLNNPEEPRSRILLIGLVSLLICACNFALGRITSRKKYCRESSQILGQKNTNLTLFLALQYAGPLIAMGPLFYVLWHNTWNAWQMYSYDKRKWKKERRLKIHENR